MTEYIRPVVSAIFCAGYIRLFGDNGCLVFHRYPQIESLDHKQFATVTAISRYECWLTFATHFNVAYPCVNANGQRRAYFCLLFKRFNAYGKIFTSASFHFRHLKSCPLRADLRRQAQCCIRCIYRLPKRQGSRQTPPRQSRLRRIPQAQQRRYSVKA